MYVGIYYSGVSSPIASTVGVKIGGSTVLATEAPCSTPFTSNCTLRGADFSTYYRLRTATFTATSVSADLSIDFAATIPGEQIYDTTVDDVTVTLLAAA
jgi:hypothetical protein